VHLTHLERTAQGLRECERMLEEAEAGEKLLAESSSKRTAFRKKLGLDIETNTEQQEISTNVQASKTILKKHFKRKPSRDATGLKKTRRN